MVHAYAGCREQAINRNTMVQDATSNSPPRPPTLISARLLCVTALCCLCCNIPLFFVRISFFGDNNAIFLFKYSTCTSTLVKNAHVVS